MSLETGAPQRTSLSVEEARRRILEAIRRRRAATARREEAQQPQKVVRVNAARTALRDVVHEATQHRLRDLRSCLCPCRDVG